jgi:hypothetical protein
MSRGVVSGNTTSSSSSFSSGGGGYVGSNGAFTMSGGAVSGNITSSSSSSYGGGVSVGSGTFTMNGGTVSGNTATSSFSSGGGVYVNGATFTMSGGTVSGNTAAATTSSFYACGGGVYVVNSGTFTMSGGVVSGNMLSGINSFGREVVVTGATFRMSGDAWPERVFLYNNSSITISGPLSGPVTPIDLGIGSLTGWVTKPILALDSSYSSGDLANLKIYFTLGNSKMMGSPYTEAAITGYGISDGGLFVAE